MPKIIDTYPCYDCKVSYEIMVDRKDRRRYIQCKQCGEQIERKIQANILKKEIEERTHGGVISNGKVWRKYTGFTEMHKQHVVEEHLFDAMKSGDDDVAQDAAKELKVLQDATKAEVSK